jgi:hypothetical protein
MTVIHAECDGCRRNTTALKEIIAECGGRPGVSRVVMFAIDPLPATDSFVRRLNLMPDRIFSFPTTNTLDIREVPTTFALNLGGRVVGVWPGQLTDKAVDQISQQCSQQSVTKNKGE